MELDIVFQINIMLRCMAEGNVVRGTLGVSNITDPLVAEVLSMWAHDKIFTFELIEMLRAILPEGHGLPAQIEGLAAKCAGAT